MEAVCFIPFVSSHRSLYRIVQLVSLNVEYAFVNPYFCVSLFYFIAPLKSENDSWLNEYCELFAQSIFCAPPPLFGAAPQDMWDHSSLTRDWTRVTALDTPSSTQWTTRGSSLFIKKIILFIYYFFVSAGSSLLPRLFSSCSVQGLLTLRCRARAVESMDSVAVTPRL